MFHVIWLGSNSLEHKPKEEPSWPMFEQHLHHVHEVAGTQLGVPSCIHHYVWLRWTRLDIMALAPLQQKPYKFYFYWEGPHTHPAHENKGWVCMGNSTWHDMNQGNPEVRPTTKVHEDRTKDEGNTAGTPNNCTAATSRAATQPAAHTHTEQKHRKTARQKNTSEQSQTDRPQGHSSQARTDRQTSPFRLRFKEKRKKKKRKKKNKVNKITMEQSHYHEHVQIRWKAKSPSKFIFRLVTAVSFTSNWCTTVPYQKTKKKEYHLQTWAFCKIIQLSGFDAVGRAGGRMFFNTDVSDLDHVRIFIPESRTT